MSRSTARLLASGSALRGVNLAAQIVVAFFLTPFVIHSLGDRMYGFWALVGTFVGYYGLMELGLARSVTRYIAAAAGKGSRDEYAKVFSSGLQLYTVLGVVVLAVTGAIAFLAPFFMHETQDAALFQEVILILGFSVALGFPVYAYQGLLRAELRLDTLAVIDISILLLRTALVVAVLLAGYKLMALAWVTLFCDIPRIVSTFWLARRQCPWLHYRRQPWLGRWTKTLLSYGGYALLAQLSDQMRYGLATFVIAGFLGLGLVTHFRIAGLMVAYFGTLMVALFGTILPWFSRMEGEGNHAAIRKTFLFMTKLSFCTASFIGFGFIAWGKPFIQRWMGPAYLDAYACLAVLAVSRAMSLGQAPSVSLLFGTSNHKVYALVSTGETVLNLGLSLWLVTKLGIFGAALGISISIVVAKLIVLPPYVCKVSRVPYGEYMRELGKSTLIVAAALVVPALISVRYVEPSYLNLAAVAITSFICYVLVVGILQFNKTERETFLRAILPNRRSAAFPTVLTEGDAR